MLDRRCVLVDTQRSEAQHCLDVDSDTSYRRLISNHRSRRLLYNVYTTLTQRLYMTSIRFNATPIRRLYSILYNVAVTTKLQK